MKKIEKIMRKYFSDASYITTKDNYTHANFHGFGDVEVVEKKNRFFFSNTLPNGSHENAAKMVSELQKIKPVVRKQAISETLEFLTSDID